MATINGTSGNDVLFGDINFFPENDVINGFDGDDDLQGGSGNDTINGGAGNDNLQGGADNDSLIGGSGTDFMDGGGGDDTLIGGTGNDFLIGNFGNDLYVVDSIGDSITEYSAQDGTDTVQSSVSWTLGTFLENLTLTGTASISGTGNSLDNTINGNSGNNGLSGGDGNDTLNGGAGKDTLIGGAGNDTYIIDSTTDTIIELANGGNDTVRSSVSYTLGDRLDNLILTGSNAINGTGNGGSNKITGNNANNVLNGSGGNDTLSGLSGNDTLIGGSGNDVLVGGGGNDSFKYATGAAFSNATLGVDTITDFQTANDKIVLSKKTFTALTSNVGIGFSKSSEFAVVANDAAAATSKAFIVYSQGTGNLFYNQNGSSAGLGTGAGFATLTTNPLLAATNFILEA
ncbi:MULTISPECIES: calcium-binding protein [Nostoc]|uniref:Calcium-binding protein n=1 Tax=Nostoc paludosum FACHB-159 TaxID=2692908 RepID=A0ABR8K1V5_9NOSO|nr:MULTISPECIES: calcium-binding protein [Nostoc]MBD2678282.1 calcium-binding protein [Nostoc sp. FACHB-857]MBD2733400.1 calcium-binding protein [Nostoc paludosum FACHB-159]